MQGTCQLLVVHAFILIMSTMLAGSCVVLLLVRKLFWFQAPPCDPAVWACAVLSWVLQAAGTIGSRLMSGQIQQVTIGSSSVAVRCKVRWWLSSQEGLWWLCAVLCCAVLCCEQPRGDSGWSMLHCIQAQERWLFHCLSSIDLAIASSRLGYLALLVIPCPQD